MVLFIRVLHVLMGEKSVYDGWGWSYPAMLNPPINAYITTTADTQFAHVHNFSIRIYIHLQATTTEY